MNSTICFLSFHFPFSDKIADLQDGREVAGNSLAVKAGDRHCSHAGRADEHAAGIFKLFKSHSSHDYINAEFLCRPQHRYSGDTGENFIIRGGEHRAAHQDVEIAACPFQNLIMSVDEQGFKCAFLSIV